MGAAIPRRAPAPSGRVRASGGGGGHVGAPHDYRSRRPTLLVYHTDRRYAELVDVPKRGVDHVLPDRLAGKTMAIVGLGDIGRDIARVARGLGMRVLGVSRRGRPVREAARMYKVGGMARAMAQADFVVLLLPLTTETRGIVGADQPGAMKPTAWLVNLARGARVNEAALLDGLDQPRSA